MERSSEFLSQYANDPEQNSRFFASARIASKRHARMQDVTDLCATLNGMADPSFQDMLPDFERLLASDSIRKYFQDEVECSLLSDIYQAQGQAIDNEAMQGLQFIDGEHFAVAVVVADPTSIVDKKRRNRDKSTSVMMTPKDLLVRFIKAGGARITVYSCDALNDDAPPDREMRCQPGNTFVVEDGDTLVLRAGRDSFSFESSESVVCFAQAYAKHSQVSVMPEFDSQTLQLIGLSATNDKASRIQMMTTILRLFDHADAFEIALPFIEHRDYFVRWYVMREMLAIDFDKAWPLVERMAANDPHPQVRSTAQKTLALLRPNLAA